MNLSPNSTFFNWTNNPWAVVAHPDIYGEWIPPGNAFSSCVLNVVFNDSNPMDRPRYLILQSCQSETGGSADILMYASDAGEYGAGVYPWKMKSFIPLVVAHCADTSTGIAHSWAECTAAQIDLLMAMKPPSGIRFGVACRSTDGGNIRWHSARMLAYT